MTFGSSLCHLSYWLTLQTHGYVEGDKILWWFRYMIMRNLDTPFFACISFMNVNENMDRSSWRYLQLPATYSLFLPVVRSCGLFIAGTFCTGHQLDRIHSVAAYFTLYMSHNYVFVMGSRHVFLKNSVIPAHLSNT